MSVRFLPIVLGALHVAMGGPAVTLQDLEMADDTVSVGSYIREVRAAAVSFLICYISAIISTMFIMCKKVCFTRSKLIFLSTLQINTWNIYNFKYLHFC